MYKHILLAYDGTLEGAIALREGALLAKSVGAEIFLLSVVPDSGALRVAEGLQSGPAQLYSEKYQEVLDRGVSRLKAFGFNPAAKLASGDPAKVIGAYAKNVKADLIVIGHQRRTLLERWWSGPSGAYVSDYTSCSILIARNPVSDDAFDIEMRAANEH